MARLFFIEGGSEYHDDLGRAKLRVEMGDDGMLALIVDAGENAMAASMSYDEAATLMQDLHTKMKLSVERG
jgi:hypothetical protein